MKNRSGHGTTKRIWTDKPCEECGAMMIQVTSPTRFCKPCRALHKSMYRTDRPLNDGRRSKLHGKVAEVPDVAFNPAKLMSAKNIDHFAATATEILQDRATYLAPPRRSVCRSEPVAEPDSMFWDGVRWQRQG